MKALTATKSEIKFKVAAEKRAKRTYPHQVRIDEEMETELRRRLRDMPKGTTVSDVLRVSLKVAWRLV